MLVYETWMTAPYTEAPRFPPGGGLTPTMTDDGVFHVPAELPDLTLEVRPEPSAFPFPRDDEKNTNRTGHPEFVVRWNGETHRGTGVHEQIQPGGTGTSPEAAAERARQLEADASLGLHDCVVLYDEKGRLWHMSQGTLTADFAYQHATEVLPAQSRDVLVRWTATAYDETARQHRPTAWLVDVPAWTMRVRVHRWGEHLGPRPVPGRRMRGEETVKNKRKGRRAGIFGVHTTQEQILRLFPMINTPICEASSPGPEKRVAPVPTRYA